MKRFEISEYIAAGCFQVERGPGFAVGVGLHGFTDGRMCDGCPKFKEGRCPSYKELTRGLAQKKAKDKVRLLYPEGDSRIEKKEQELKIKYYRQYTTRPHLAR